MLSGRELSYGLAGAWRLVRGDPGAMLCFNRTWQGFWRSFWVAVLLAPAQAILIGMNLNMLGLSVLNLHNILVETGFYILDWLLLPAVVGEIALRTGRVPQFVGFVIANNYAQILMAAVWLIMVVIASMMPPGMGGLLQLITLALVLVYQLRIVRVAMEMEPMPAVLLVILAFALSFMLQQMSDWILTGGHNVL